MYIDSHAHIEGSEFDSDREAVIQRALDAGVEIIVCVGNGEVASDSHAAAFRVAEEYPFIYTTVGVHPHEARLLDGSLYANLMGLSQHPKVIAWGEIGLDYHYDFSPREVQQRVFAEQLATARALELPVVIHTREADEDTFAMLADDGAGVGGVFHCFTGGVARARRALDLGFYVSLAGILTFPKATDLHEVAAFMPLDRLLIETDSPFLAPVPHRGKRNEPANVVRVAETVAMLRGSDVTAIGEAALHNFERLFNP